MSGPHASPINGPRRPGGGVLHVLGQVTPPLQERGDVSRYALGRRMLLIRVHVAVIEGRERSPGRPVVGRALPLPHSQVVAHARRLSHRTDKLAPLVERAG